MVSSTAAALVAPVSVQSSSALNSFLLHYTRQGYGIPPKGLAAQSCTDMYNEVILKMRNRTDYVSAGSTLAAHGLLAVVASVAVLCA